MVRDIAFFSLLTSSNMVSVGNGDLYRVCVPVGLFIEAGTQPSRPCVHGLAQLVLATVSASAEEETESSA